jgi:hypothetical protein
MDYDKLVDEVDVLRRDCRSLRSQNDVLQKDPERVREMLAAMDARLASCSAGTVFAADPTPMQQEALREIRSRAAVMALQCMGIMQLCASAVLPSALLRVRVAALRPREAGGKDADADAVVPAIFRVYAKSLPLRIGTVLLWLVGVMCQYLVLFDRFEPGSAQEWLSCAAVSVGLPVSICVGASLNAKTVRELFKKFETLYVLAYVLGMTTLTLFLFRDRPAKMVAFALGIPSYTLSGLQDASAEGSRLLNSRVFFTCNVAALLAALALVSLKRGSYLDYTFEVGTFAFAASSMVVNAISTLLVFGVKNIVLSFHEPGSLVVLVSSVCCVFLDAEALAVLKGAYSLIGQSFGKYNPNRTIDKYLKRQRSALGYR